MHKWLVGAVAAVALVSTWMSCPLLAQSERDRPTGLVDKQVSDALSSYVAGARDLLGGRFDDAADDFGRCRAALDRHVPPIKDGEEVSVWSIEHFEAVTPGASPVGGTKVERDCAWGERTPGLPSGRIYEHRVFLRIPVTRWKFYAQWGQEVAQRLRADRSVGEQAVAQAGRGVDVNTPGGVENLFVRLGEAADTVQLHQQHKDLEEVKARTKSLKADLEILNAEIMAGMAELRARGKSEAEARAEMEGKFDTRIKALGEEVKRARETGSTALMGEFNARYNEATQAVRHAPSHRPTELGKLEQWQSDYEFRLSDDDRKTVDSKVNEFKSAGS